MEPASYRIPHTLKGGDAYLVDRSLVFEASLLVVRAAHPEAAGRNGNQLHRELGLSHGPLRHRHRLAAPGQGAGERQERHEDHGGGDGLQPEQ